MPIIRPSKGFKQALRSDFASPEVLIRLDWESASGEPMGRQEADEMAAWHDDGIRNGYIEDVTRRKPLKWPSLPFEIKATVKRRGS